MQTLKDLSENEVKHRLQTSGIALNIGPFNISFTSDYLPLTKPVRNLYANYPLLNDVDFVDFNIRLLRSKGIRRYIKPQINFYFDDNCPFKPLPLNEAFALLEWGMNWCIGAHAHQFLIIHSAVLAKNSKVLILPGDPGSGKSTLCAALCGEGWKLLSDELALVDKASGLIYPVGRPISLKNKSIDIIKNKYQHLQPGSIVSTLTKGDVAHISLPEYCIDSMNTPLPAAFIIFPKYNSNATFSFEALTKPAAFLKTIENSFNYSQLGQEGFDVMGTLIDSVQSYNIFYSNLDSAIEFINQQMEL